MLFFCANIAFESDFQGRGRHEVHGAAHVARPPVCLVAGVAADTSQTLTAPTLTGNPSTSRHFEQSILELLYHDLV